MTILPPAGSAVAAGATRFIAPGVPELMAQSPDWRVRFDPSPVYVRPSHLGQLERTARERALYTDVTLVLPEGLGLDVYHARSVVEEAYAPRVAALTQDDMEAGGGVYHSPDLLLAHERHLLPGRASLPPVVAVQSDASFYPPRGWREFERMMRHQLRVFVSYQNREVDVLHEQALPTKFVRLPPWWKKYEVSLSFLAETPWYFTYRGLALIGAGNNDESAEWNVILSEWLQNCEFELMYEARRGVLHCLPPAVVVGIREMNPVAVLPDSPQDDITDLRTLLDMVERVRWSQVPPQQRLLPADSGPFTPIYQGGDWVEFNPESWTVVSPPGGLIFRNAHGTIPRDDRGLRVLGTTLGMLDERAPVPTMGGPGGPGVGGGSAIAGGRYPSLAQRSGASRRGLRDSELLMSDVMQHVGGPELKDALARNGMVGRPTFVGVATLLQRVLVEGVAPVLLVRRDVDGDVDIPDQAGPGPAEAGPSGSTPGAEPGSSLTPPEAGN